MSNGLMNGVAEMMKEVLELYRGELLGASDCL